MIAGAGLLLELAMFAPRHRQVTRTTTNGYGVAPARQTMVTDFRF